MCGIIIRHFCISYIIIYDNYNTYKIRILIIHKHIHISI